MNRICKNAFLQEQEEALQKQVAEDKRKLAYIASSWALVGVGVAGIAAGATMFALKWPMEVYAFEGFDINYDEAKVAAQSHNAQVMAARVVPLALGGAALIAGSGMLIADYIIQKRKNSGISTDINPNSFDQGQITPVSQHSWSPYVFAHPDFSGAGAILYY